MNYISPNQRQTDEWTDSSNNLLNLWLGRCLRQIKTQSQKIKMMRKYNSLLMISYIILNTIAGSITFFNFGSFSTERISSNTAFIIEGFVGCAMIVSVIIAGIS